MALKSKLTNLGIELSFDDGDDPKPLVPATDADQENPRSHYVYAHLDRSGQIFYIGIGVGKRAWSTDRHPLWSRYVEKHLNSNYQTRILLDNLSPKDAEAAEAAWIAQCSDTLVNWINMGRQTDFSALDRFHQLRNANRSLIEKAKSAEKHNLVQAVTMYVEAIDAIDGYATISYEKGLVGQLLDEETAEFGESGEILALDRLTMCLIKLGKPEEAARYSDNYFTKYRGDLTLSASDRITSRIKKALARKQP